VEFVKAVCRRL